MSLISFLKRSKSGFTLVEAMVAMGLVVMGGVAMMKVSQTQSDSDIRIQTSQAVNLEVHKFKLALEDTGVCEKNFVSNIGSMGQIESKFQGGILDAGGKMISLTSSKYIKNARYEVIEPSSWPAPGDIGEVFFKVKVHFTTVEQALDQAIVIEPGVFLETDKNAIVRTCLTPMKRKLREMQKRLCHEMGGVYDIKSSGEKGVFCKLGNSPPTPSSGISQTYLENFSFAPRYLQMNFSGHQRIYGPVSFSRLSPSNSSANLRLKNTGSYPGDEQRAFSYEWWHANYIKVLKQIPDQKRLCDGPGEMLLLTNQGARCLNISTDLRCDQSSGPSYLRGYDRDGNKVCVPLLGSTGVCKGEGSLVVKDGRLHYECNSTAPSCKPVDGQWQAVSPPQKTCLDGRLYVAATCVGRACGGKDCIGPARVEVGTCPKYHKYVCNPLAGSWQRLSTCQERDKSGSACTSGVANTGAEVCCEKTPTATCGLLCENGKSCQTDADCGASQGGGSCNTVSAGTSGSCSGGEYLSTFEQKGVCRDPIYHTDPFNGTVSVVSNQAAYQGYCDERVGTACWQLSDDVECTWYPNEVKLIQTRGNCSSLGQTSCQNQNGCSWTPPSPAVKKCHCGGSASTCVQGKSCANNAACGNGLCNVGYCDVSPKAPKLRDGTQYACAGLPASSCHGNCIWRSTGGIPGGGQVTYGQCICPSVSPGPSLLKPYYWKLANAWPEHYCIKRGLECISKIAVFQCVNTSGMGVSASHCSGEPLYGTPLISSEVFTSLKQLCPEGGTCAFTGQRMTQCPQRGDQQCVAAAD